MTAQDPGVLAASNGSTRRTLRALALAAAILTAAGCGSVQVQRGKNLATAGVEYSRATADLLDAATDAMIDADSGAFVRSRLTGPGLTPKLVDELQGELDGHDAKLISNTKKMVTLHASLSATESYFLALQNLVDNPQSDGTATAVSNLSDQINALNGAIKKHGDDAVKPLLSEEQKTAVAGLSKLVADQIHGAKVAAALKRDAPVIGEALKLQERIIALSGSVLNGALIDQNAVFYTDRVKAPFAAQDIGETWIGDRNTYIKAKAIGETSKELQAARDAAKQMDAIWQKILSGVYDTGEIAAQVAEIQAVTAALVKVKQAEKPKAP